MEELHFVCRRLIIKTAPEFRMDSYIKNVIPNNQAMVEKNTSHSRVGTAHMRGRSGSCSGSRLPEGVSFFFLNKGNVRKAP